METAEQVVCDNASSLCLRGVLFNPQLGHWLF
jgi:hypothetical protein